MTISEIAKKCGVSADTLRYYEKLGVVPSVPRNNSGIRIYDEYFLDWFLFIQQLKDSGMSLDSIAKYMMLARTGDSTHSKRKQLLIDAQENLQERIDLLQELINKAKYQLLHYDSELLPQTKKIMDLYFQKEKAAV